MVIVLLCLLLLQMLLTVLKALSLLYWRNMRVYLMMNTLGAPYHLILRPEIVEVKNQQMMEPWISRIMGFMMRKMMLIRN
uniref:Uncharacterized protein n=1 Tax=Arundo donax TaxID=35708 RepID=A0A0A9CHW5_ARUDO